MMRMWIGAVGVACVVAVAGCLQAPPSMDEVDGAAGGSTITHRLLTAGAGVENRKDYATAAISPEPDSLVTVALAIHRSSEVPDVGLTGGGIASWDPVATISYNLEGATPLDRVAIFRGTSAAPGDGPIIITASETISNCQWIVSQWSGVDVSGSNGAAAVEQSGSQSGESVAGLTVELAPFRRAGNAAYGVFGVVSKVPAVTPGGGFTVIDEQPSGENTPGDVFAEWAVGQPEVTAAWSGLSGGALAVELALAP